ncbi:MAG TPA: ABC transporter permease [Acidimicrobiales bacterium]|nr:ABC transporter permease [Acidimicrobiales bacterium]
MARYGLRRLVALVPIWLVITFLAFLVAALSPGDPARTMLERQGGERPTAAEVSRLRRELHLDEPVPLQYLRWVAGAVTGDLGTSYRGDPVLPTLRSRFAASLRLALPALTLALAVAIPLGTLSAVRRGTLVDNSARAATLVTASVPSFLIGYLLIIVFSVRLHVLPASGTGSLNHLVLPTLTLAAGSTASLSRLARSSLLDVLGDDYVRTARAKGLPLRRVVVGHALANSLLPVVTMTGIRFARLLAGAAIVETVFSWPGIGRYVVESINERDYPAIQGAVLFTGTVFVVVNLAADLVCARIDPRIQLAGEER